MNGIWIRSQDRSGIELCTNVWVAVDETEGGTVTIQIETDNTILAIYPTKERALEVLDEIQHAIYGELKGFNIYQKEFWYNAAPIFVFEMPLK